MSSGTSGAQDWRAVACLAPSGERLLCVGESSSQVRAAYTGAWGEVIRDEDRPTVRAISLQRWTGQFWSGQWEHQMYLAVPTARGGKAGDGRRAEEERNRKRNRKPPEARNRSNSEEAAKSKVKRSERERQSRFVAMRPRLWPGDEHDPRRGSTDSIDRVKSLVAMRSDSGPCSGRLFALRTDIWTPGTGRVRPGWARRSGWGMPGRSVGQLFDAQSFGGVMAGGDQADAQALGLERAVKPRLAGQQDVGPGRAASLRKSSPAPQATATTLTIRWRIADHRHGNAPELRPADAANPPAARLDQSADPAGSWVMRSRARVVVVKRIDVDRGLFVRMVGADRRQHAASRSRRADEFQPELADRLAASPLAHDRIGRLGPEKRTLAGDRERAFFIRADLPAPAANAADRRPRDRSPA